MSPAPQTCFHGDVCLFISLIHDVKRNIDSYECMLLVLVD